jgi:hypothetical protein
VTETTEHGCGCVTRFGPPDYYPVFLTECEAHKAAEHVPHIKVGYYAEDRKSVAYVAEDSEPGSDIHYGTNKHTDAPVRVRFNTETDRWEEVP